MANDLSNIRNSILEIVNLPKNFYYGVVKSVNNDVCDLELGNLTLTEVPLSLNPADKSEAKIIVTPQVGSTVLFLDLTGRLTDLMIIKFSEIEGVKLQFSKDIKVDINPQGVNIDSKQITINGGGKNGLINIAVLTEKINGLVGTVNSLVNAFNTHAHLAMGSATGTPITPPTPPTPSSSEDSPPAISVSSAAKFAQKDYEDTTIKH